MDGQAAGKPWQCILGNHDLMFHQFVTTANVLHPEIKSGKTWLHHKLGGVMTLASYMDGVEIDHPEWVSWDHAKAHGLDPASDSLLATFSEVAKHHVPTDHLDWIIDLPPYVDGPENHRFVHAGIQPDVAIDAQTRSDLIWIRDGWLDYDGPLDRMYVHGHTALDFPQHHGNRINLDGGAGFGRPLVPCGFDGSNWFTLDETGRFPLRP
jgi:serine/threonine protein phosphatase 1